MLQPSARSLFQFASLSLRAAISNTMATLNQNAIQVCDQSARASVLHTGEPKANPAAIRPLIGAEQKKRAMKKNSTTIPAATVEAIRCCTSPSAL